MDKKFSDSEIQAVLMGLGLLHWKNMDLPAERKLCPDVDNDALVKKFLSIATFLENNGGR